MCSSNDINFFFRMFLGIIYEDAFMRFPLDVNGFFFIIVCVACGLLDVIVL